MGMFARLFGGFSGVQKAEPRPERRNAAERRGVSERRSACREFDIDRRSGCERRLGIDWRDWI